MFSGDVPQPARAGVPGARGLSHVAHLLAPNAAGNRLAEGKSELTGLLGGPTRSEKD